MMWTYELSREAQTPADFTCMNPACDEAAPAARGGVLVQIGVSCPRCKSRMHRAPYARAVQRPSPSLPTI